MHPNFQKVIFVGIYLCISIYGYSQESYINNRWDIQFGYNAQNKYYQPLNNDFYMESIILKSTYGYGKLFESGLYAGKTFYKHHNLSFFPETSYIFFGISQKIQVIPLFVKKSKYRFDVYTPLSLGFSYMVYPDNVAPKIRTNNYSIGIGFAAHLFKNFGLYTEFNYNNKVQEKFNPYFQFGLSYAWKNDKTEKYGKN